MKEGSKSAFQLPEEPQDAASWGQDKTSVCHVCPKTELEHLDWSALEIKPVVILEQVHSSRLRTWYMGLQ